jgi:hypothetical protein
LALGHHSRSGGTIKHLGGESFLLPDLREKLCVEKGKNIQNEQGGTKFLGNRGTKAGKKGAKKNNCEMGNVKKCGDFLLFLIF